MKKVGFWLLILFILNSSCGVETILILLPAIAANWCTESDQCHVFEFRASQDHTEKQEVGNIGGVHYYTWDDQQFKTKDRTFKGYNYIIGSWNGLNIEFEVHYRLDARYQEYFIGSIEPQDDGSKKMYIENLTSGEKLTLLTPDKCSCKE